MTRVDVSRVDPNGLRLVRYRFELDGMRLIYRSYMEYRRDSPEEAWGFDWPKPKEFRDWCEFTGLDPDDYCGRSCDCCRCGPVHRTYDAYLAAADPIRQKTADGHPKAGGCHSNNIGHLLPCPDDAAIEALQKLTGSIEVVWGK